MLKQKSLWATREDVIHKARWTFFKTNPDYLKAVPRPPQKRYDEIKQDIKLKGQLIPIIVNENMIVLDGHTRFDICKELNIEIKYIIRTFENKLEEERFVYAVNVKKRDLPDFVHIRLAFKIAEIDEQLTQKAKENQKLGGKGFVISQKAKIDVTKKVASETKTGSQLVSRAHTIIKKGTKEEIESLENGSENINKIYKVIKKREKKEERQKAIKQLQVNLPNTVQLYNKPFQEIEIKENSIGLIFTDPPYEEAQLSLYKDLAKQASKVLRDGGSLLCYSGHFCIDRVIEYMKEEGLNYHWIISVDHSGASASVFGRKILVGWKPILWFVKGKYQGEFVKDKIKSEFQGKELHDWAQSTIESDYYIKYMTLPNEIIYDPFLGQGTFGVSAVKQGRQFIGAEIDKNHFETAQKLISAASNKK